MDRLEQFADSLRRSVELIHQLEGVMLEEMRAIESRAPEQLQQIVVEKLELVDRLEHETAQQKGWVELEHHSFTPEGIDAFITAVDPKDQLRKPWGELRAGIGRCDGLNKKNARLIERDQKRIALSLRILKGEDGASSTYDPKGRAQTSRIQGRTISQA
ncbi:flagellar protein FlgN [Thiorhodococcus mannitoliphagus]|uniref:Flagellar protein FlgN n=1 Tax=Thiorhodococcus mannitoliphagus TaxID=329406 RepID=A0A6P1DTE0_9GAMM|nr:flagellar protein FlgN [Thiorhodococcus mannitoliphagus]NEX21079.1 flagellar protein FlgN [Thiorhodococcus mannitoliphagus]